MKSGSPLNNSLRAYLENNKFENVIIWDTPGVGTPTYKLEQHDKLIDQIKCDAFVYLYDTQFNEVDKKVIQMIRSKKKTGVAK